MFRLQWYPLAVCLILASVPPAHAGQPAAAVSKDGSRVVFEAHDYQFTGPDRIAAGVTTMQVQNKGQDVHHIQLLKLQSGKTSHDFLAAVKANPEHSPSWVQHVGGPNAILPGQESAATMTLTEGEYLLVCYIPDKAGVPHMALGMHKTVTVTPGRSHVAAEPKADVRITLADYRFDLSAPIVAGRHTFQVLNRGTQPHEVVLLKLEGSASAKDVAAAFEPGASGPPPGAPVGGVVGIEKGGQAYFTADFKPGRYGLICFFPDPTTGKPHFAHGMTSEFTVK
jgi:uncharacterized cupredoxin-like copper-binding protein